MSENLKWEHLVDLCASCEELDQILPFGTLAGLQAALGLIGRDKEARTRLEVVLGRIRTAVQRVKDTDVGLKPGR